MHVAESSFAAYAESETEFSGMISTPILTLIAGTTAVLAFLMISRRSGGDR